MRRDEDTTDIGKVRVKTSMSTRQQAEGMEYRSWYRRNWNTGKNDRELTTNYIQTCYQTGPELKGTSTLSIELLCPHVYYVFYYVSSLIIHEPA